MARTARYLASLLLLFWTSVGNASPEDWQQCFRERQVAAQQAISPEQSDLFENQIVLMHVQLVRFETNQGPLDVGAFTATIDKLNKRLVTSDFQLNSLI